MKTKVRVRQLLYYCFFTTALVLLYYTHIGSLQRGRNVTVYIWGGCHALNVCVCVCVCVCIGGRRVRMFEVPREWEGGVSRGDWECLENFDSDDLWPEKV